MNLQAAVLSLVFLVGVTCLVGCGPSSTADECKFIFDRIVELELEQRGFADPVLAAKKKRELQATLKGELSRCEGHRLPDGARECVTRATSVLQISQECLR